MLSSDVVESRDEKNENAPHNGRCKFHVEEIRAACKVEDGDKLFPRLWNCENGETCRCLDHLLSPVDTNYLPNALLVNEIVYI